MYKPFERVEKAFKSIKSIVGIETYLCMFNEADGYARHLIQNKQDYLFDVEVFENEKTITPLDLEENEECYLIHYVYDMFRYCELYYITKYMNGKFWGNYDFSLQYHGKTYPNTVAVIHVKKCNKKQEVVL